MSGPGQPDGEMYLRPYREVVSRRGPGFHATLWGSREAQELRFDVMIDLACFDACTIVDAGCGQGDFADRLMARQVPFGRYVGIDAVAEMVEAARERGFDSLLGRVSFVVADLVAREEELARHEPDFVCFSGTLNTMDEPAARKLVAAAFEASARGVVFNFLSDRHHARWADRCMFPARRFDTVAWIDWALGLSSRVSFTQDYLDGHDATVMITHD